MFGISANEGGGLGVEAEKDVLIPLSAGGVKQPVETAQRDKSRA
jgi:hypothetical protein